MSTKRRAYLTEMKTQLTLAVPALLAQIAMISMGFVDMVMTGRVGAVDMAAVALAGSLWVPLVLFGQGLLLAVTPCVAQLRGAGSMRSGEHMQGVGHVMRQGIWMALFISVPLILIVYLVSFHLADMGVEGALGLMTGQYLRAIIWGAPAYLLFVALRCGMEGMALMRPAMFAGFMGLLINIPCNYILIFGKLGLPALGGPGTGVATAIVYWVMFLTMVVYVCRHTYLRELMTWRVWEVPVWATLKKLAGIGFPGALAMLFEVTLFAAVALLIAPLGAIQVAGHIRFHILTSFLVGKLVVLPPFSRGNTAFFKNAEDFLKFLQKFFERTKCARPKSPDGRIGIVSSIQMIRQFIYISVVSPGGGRAFFDKSITVGFCRYAFCFMAATSFSRRFQQ